MHFSIVFDIDDVPEPTRDPSAEQVEAYRVILETLFAQYPPDDSVIRPDFLVTAEYCRERAMWRCTDYSVQAAAYWACDTGVPNDEIMIPYLLIFT